MRPRAKLALLTAMLATFSLLAIVVAVEVGLRAAGYRPWRSFHGTPIEPTMHDPDPELGWWLRPGHWQYGPLAPGGTPVEVTVGSDRSRRTRPHMDADPQAPLPRVLLLGGSYTFGWAVSDDETWAWRLQVRRPDLDIRNHGTGAYGTLQSLLLMQRILDRGERFAHVIYAFNSEQTRLNVLDPDWVRALAAWSRQEIIAVPYCTLEGDGRLVQHPPEAYPAWPLHESSAAITLLEDRWFTLRARKRRTDAAEVTRRLVATMADRCRRDGIRFSLLLLQIGSPGRDEIVPFAGRQGIELIDCDRPVTKLDRVPGELHPNGRFNAGWGDCVADGLGAARDRTAADPSGS